MYVLLPKPGLEWDDKKKKYLPQCGFELTHQKYNTSDTIEVDGNNMDVLMSEMESIAELLTQFDAGEVFFADDAQQKAELWKLRRRVAEAVKTSGYTIEWERFGRRYSGGIRVNF